MTNFGGVTHLIFRHIQLVFATIRAEHPTAVPTVSPAAQRDVQKVSFKAIRTQWTLRNLIILNPALVRRTCQPTGRHELYFAMRLLTSSLTAGCGGPHQIPPFQNLNLSRGFHSNISGVTMV